MLNNKPTNTTKRQIETQMKFTHSMQGTSINTATTRKLTTRTVHNKVRYETFTRKNEESVVEIQLNNKYECFEF